MEQHDATSSRRCQASGTIAPPTHSAVHPPAREQLLRSLGIESWKPVITALVLPPVPLLLLVLVGARLLLPRRGLGWLVIVISVALLWLSACSGAVRFVSQLLPSPPAALSFDRVRELRAESTAKKPVAIVVLGAGSEPFAPGVRREQPAVGLARAPALRHLARRPDRRAGRLQRRHRLCAGRVDDGGTRRRQDRRRRVRPADPLDRERSRSDTRENAARTMAMLKSAGINHVVLVDERLPHAARAARVPRSRGRRRPDRAGADGAGHDLESPTLQWLPSADGFRDIRQLLRERAGRPPAPESPLTAMAWRGSLAIDYRRATAARSSTTATTGRCACCARSIPKTASATACSSIRRAASSAATRSRSRSRSRDGTHALVTTPGATRFYRSAGAAASQSLRGRRRREQPPRVAAARDDRLQRLRRAATRFGSSSPQAPR